MFLILINLKLIQWLNNSVRCVRSYAKTYLTYMRQILKTSTISYIQFHIRVCTVHDAHFPSFKTYVIFVTRIIFHLKRYAREKHSLSFKTLVMSATRIPFCLKHSHCSRRAISFIQNVLNDSDPQFHIILHCAPRNNH